MGKLDKVLETADENDGINVDMKRDWKRIFAFEKLGMRNMKKYITPKGVRTSRPAIAGIVTLILFATDQRCQGGMAERDRPHPGVC